VHALPGEELHQGDELAFLPPLAGGSPVSRLTRAGIDVAELLNAISDPGLGGTVVFLGSVRQGAEDGPVEAIEYSAYDEMAVAELDRIIGEAQDRWKACRVEVQHRLGRIPVKEASIAVVVAAPHRGEAFEACRYVIEQIKVRLPIWKKEIFQNGSAGWRGNDGSRGPAAAV
jgi:molybdopterin synthase catalytic subunit